jgi:hypothetical protein
MNKLNLNPVHNESTMSLNINEFKCFAFIDQDQINKYNKLGFNIEIDDEINQIYYAEVISTDMLTLQFLYDECKYYGIGFHVEYEDEIYDMEEVFNNFLS